MTSKNNLFENFAAGPSKSPKLQPERLDEIKTSLKKEIMSDLTKILADNQKGMLKLIAPAIKKVSTVQNLKSSDSESEGILPNTTSTPIRTKTTTSKTTPVNGRNTHDLNFRTAEARPSVKTIYDTTEHPKRERERERKREERERERECDTHTEREREREREKERAKEREREREREERERETRERERERERERGRGRERETREGREREREREREKKKERERDR